MPPTLWSATARYKRGLLEAEANALDRFQEDIAQLVMPILFLHGTEDPFVPFQRSLEAVEEMPATGKAIHILQGARHEVRNESNRDQVIRHLTDWVEKVTTSDVVR